MSSAAAVRSSVPLADLETFQRYSVAVRSNHVSLLPLIEAMRADLADLEVRAGMRKTKRPGFNPRITDEGRPETPDVEPTPSRVQSITETVAKMRAGSAAPSNVDTEDTLDEHSLDAVDMDDALDRIVDLTVVDRDDADLTLQRN